MIFYIIRAAFKQEFKTLVNNIQIHKVDAHSAFRWITRAWELFKQQSGLWMSTAFFMLLFAIVCQNLPVIGMVVYFLTHPFLIAGYCHLVLKACNSETSQFKQLFEPFKQERTRPALIQLGTMEFVLGLVISTPAALMLQEYSTSNMIDPFLLTLSIIGLWFHSFFFLFAAPLVYFYHQMNLLSVVKLTLKGCLLNPLPLLLFSILAGLLFMTVAFTAGLTLIVVLPLLTIAGFLAFEDIFRLSEEFKRSDEDDNNNDSDYKIVV